MSDLARFKIEERIKIAMFKYRGNIIEIANELDLDLEYVKKVIGKLRKRESRDVNVLISSTLMQHLFTGYQTRTFYLFEMIRQLEGKNEYTISACHERSVFVNETGDVVCSKCGEICVQKKLNSFEVYDLKQKLIQQLRQEDEQLVEFAAKMGYTSRQNESLFNYEDKRQYLVLQNSSETKDVRQVSDVNPLELDSLRRQLEKEERQQNAQTESPIVSEKSENLSQ